MASGLEMGYWHSQWRGDLVAYLSRLSLTNYRNFRQLELDLPSGVSVFHGANAEGKTALLESVYTLAVGRSFRAGSERQVVNFDAGSSGQAAYVAGIACRDGQTINAVVGYEPAGAGDGLSQTDTAEPGAADSVGVLLPMVRKRIRVNRQPCTAARLVGLIGATLFVADDLDLVLGSPTNRRRYLDILISQAAPDYLATLQRYQAALRSRNRLLRLHRDGRVEPDEMEYWNDQLVGCGSLLVLGRAKALKHLAVSADELHRELAGSGRTLRLVYQPRVLPQDSIEHTELEFRRQLQQQASRERATGVTAVGPHRDDFIIVANGLLASDFASRGESRTIALALRLAEAEYLSRIRTDDPIILLDDVFSEMDKQRRERVLFKASGYRQALITTTDVEPVRAHFGADATYFRVADGAVSLDA